MFCPFDIKKEGCFHYVASHGTNGRCGIKKGDNAIESLKQCESKRYRIEKEEKRRKAHYPWKLKAKYNSK